MSGDTATRNVAGLFPDLSPSAHTIAVEGAGMCPSFHHGDLLVIDPKRQRKAGDFILLYAPPRIAKHTGNQSGPAHVIVAVVDMGAGGS